MSQDGVVNNSGIVEATSAHMEDGEIVLDAGDGAAIDSGSLNASWKGAGETGGMVQILGDAVTVSDGAKMDVSGDVGGGEVLIGGDFHGAGPEPNAQTTTVGTATINANAIKTGDGGKVAVWSDGDTQFAGSISAKGGALSGNGGQVETSGHNLHITNNASVNTLAANGAAGNWLLDPDDIVIDTAGAGAPNQSFGTAGSVTVAPATIVAALSSGNVTLEANDDISVLADVNVGSSGAGNTLNLLAGHSIVFGSSGSIEFGLGTVVLSANDPGAAPGGGIGPANMTLGGVSAEFIDLQLHSNGVDGGSIVTITNPFQLGSGQVAVQTNGASVFLSASGAVTIGAAGTDVGVNLKGSDAGQTPGNLTLSAASILQNAGAPILATNLIATATAGSLTLADGGNGSTDLGNEISGYALFNSAGDTSFTNTISTIVGTPVADDNVDPPNSVIGGDLTILVTDANQDVNANGYANLILDGRIHVNGTGISTLHASGNLINNNSDGALIGTVATGTSLVLISDNGSIGTSNSPFDLSAAGGTELNLRAEAPNGSIDINSGSISFGGHFGGPAILTQSLQVSANGTITQGGGGLGEISASSLNLRSTSNTDADISLTNSSNQVTGPVTFQSDTNVSFANSVATYLGTSSVGGTFTVVSASALNIVSGATLTAGAAGDALLLSAANLFINNAGSSAVQLTGGGRFLIYSQNPSNDTFGDLDSHNTAVWNTVYPAAVSVSGNRYVFAYQPVISVTSNNIAKTYGADDTAAVATDYTISGLQGGVANAYLGDTSAAVYSGTPSIITSGAVAGAGVAGSPYAIGLSVGSFAATDNYALSLNAAGHLTVTPALLVYTANPASRVFGADNPSFSGAVIGFVNGETQSSATSGALSFITPAQTSSPAGSYPIFGTGLSAPNYVFLQAATNLSALTITPPPPVALAASAPPPPPPELTSFLSSNQAAASQTGSTVTSYELPNSGAASQTAANVGSGAGSTGQASSNTSGGSDPPSSTDLATDFVIASLEGGPPANKTRGNSSVVIPGLLHAESGRTQAAATFGNDISWPAWGNAALWQ